MFYGKDLLNLQIMRSNINSENIEEVIEKLKYSSNKMTKILTSELQKNGLMNNKHRISIIPEYFLNPQEMQKKEKNTRNTLNARIIMLEHLAEEFKENPIFQGEEGKENQKKVLLYIQNVATEPSDVWRTAQMLQKRYKIDIQEDIAKMLNANSETEFKLKPETLEQIESEDYNLSYDNGQLIEQVKKAIKTPIKIKIKNKILKLKNKIFGRKKQELLPEGTKSKEEGKIQPIFSDEIKKEYIENKEGIWDLEQASTEQRKSEVGLNSWELSEEMKHEIEQKNIKIAEKFSQKQEIKQQNNLENRDDNQDGRN